MKKFFGEFKKFITRGNVLDMAVGVIVGGAFTGIVNGLSNYVLKPIINCLLALILGSEGLSGAITMLSAAYVKDATTGLDAIDAVTGEKIIDLASSIYIDWGAFISAIINFFIIAFVLFLIIRTINRINEQGDKWTQKIKDGFAKEFPTRKERKAMKKLGLDYKDKEVVKDWREKVKIEAQAKLDEENKKAELEKQEAYRHSTEGLLEEIKNLLEKSQQSK